VVAQIFSDEEIAVPIWILAMVMSWGLGRSDRTQVALGLELMQAREELARQAVLDERRRIAREVHDLVGHGLAAVMLQVTGARHVLRRDADAADEALAEAEATGRRSLHELGRTLSLLRADGDQDGAAPPVPGAGDIPALVDGGRPEGAGALRIDGDLDSIDPIVGLSLYRVTEEALTNARRHAPDADTDVVLAVADDHVVLTVESRGPLRSPDPADDRPRYGLVGMRERMTAVGGDLDVGPMPAGWIVRCRAPLTPARTAPGAGSRVAPHTADVGSGEGTDPDAAPKSADPGTPGQHPGDRHDEPGTDGRSAPLDTRPGGGT
jgi:signal transduction histidine kinase